MPYLNVSELLVVPLSNLTSSFHGRNVNTLQRIEVMREVMREEIKSAVHSTYMYSTHSTFQMVPSMFIFGI